MSSLWVEMDCPNCRTTNWFFWGDTHDCTTYVPALENGFLCHKCDFAWADEFYFEDKYHEVLDAMGIEEPDDDDAANEMFDKYIDEVKIGKCFGHTLSEWLHIYSEPEKGHIQ
jgi:hypothetical protein